MATFQRVAPGRSLELGQSASLADLVPTDSLVLAILNTQMEKRKVKGYFS